MTFSHEFINAEMLADDYVASIRRVIDLLEKGAVEQGLSIVREVESAMNITLAYGDRLNPNVTIN